jgi:hypothetical protein
MNPSLLIADVKQDNILFDLTDAFGTNPILLHDYSRSRTVGYK